MSKLPSNYNPIHHNCDDKGCWNKQYRPNIEWFYHALPRKITMSDIDATVEVNGHFLFLEWKSHQGEIPTGQRIYFQRLTGLSPNITCVFVQHSPGDPMDVESVKYCHAGKISEWEPCDLETLHERVKRWSTRVDIQTVGEAA